MKINVKKLTVSAVLIALSTVLSLIKLYELPLGGSITLLSMLPVCLISIMYGVKYAVLPSFLYAAIQLFISLGAVLGWGLTPQVLIGTIFLDYLLAHGCMFLAGVLKNKGFGGIMAGIFIALTCRFLFHFLSGIILFKSFDVFNNPYLYSLVYNGSYMLGEIILTVIGAFVLFKSKAIARLKA
ncbi:MAG: energy-coupled thiamine transporter ThiT [Acutalibacteraceae bacterium]|nr:energy-coupled thiamine transporter ThiT [Acutalibacteraceae bacterium]